VQSGDSKNSQAVQKMILKLLEPFDSPLINWIRLWNPDAEFWDKHTNLGLTNVAIPLYYASLGGLAEASQQMLASGADVNAQGGRYGNALQAASVKSHEGIVKLLLEKSADVNAQGGNYGNALQAASAKSHEGIVKLLLEKSADVNAREETMAMHCRQHQLEVMREL